MDTDLTGFSTIQQHALCDLLVLSMYADGHLTTAKDKHLESLLASMGGSDESARQGEFDAAVTRMSPFVKSIHKARTEAVVLAGVFTNRKQQKQVYEAVQQIMTADLHVSAWESTLLSELRMTFRL